MVAVGHPDLLVTFAEPAVEEAQRRVTRRHKGAAEFCRAVAPLHAAAQHLHHHLLAIANAQDRHAQIKHRFGWPRGSFVDHTGRPAREDHSLWSKLRKEVGSDVLEGVDFAVDAKFPEPARDKLSDLGPKVDDEQAIMFHDRASGFFAGVCK